MAAGAEEFEGDSMKASVVDGWPKNNRIRIHITDANASEVNSIRRTILSDVPKMAITKVRSEQGTIEEDGKILEFRMYFPTKCWPIVLQWSLFPPILMSFVSRLSK